MSGDQHETIDQPQVNKVRHGSSVANIILGDLQSKKMDYEDRSWNLAYLEVSNFQGEMESSQFFKKGPARPLF